MRSSEVTGDIETLIIGAGQSGLAMSHMLSRRNRPHLVVERSRVAERWRSERWDGLRFQFPNWSVRLPEFAFPHKEPDAFAGSREILDFLCSYADFTKAPVRTGVEVKALRANGSSGFIADTSQGTITALNVVVATGPYQRPVLPPMMRDDLPLFQVHASGYKNQAQLPPGAVLVIGSGASGAQIAEELNREGRKVLLSVGRHRRFPRRYRGRDLIWWLAELGLDQTPVEKRGPDRALPLITGAYGGHTIDFRDFAAAGITLLGHLEVLDTDVATFADDLSEMVERGNAAYSTFLDMVDAHVERHGLDVAPEPNARAKHSNRSCIAAPPRRVVLAHEGISAIIWATGYSVDFSWIALPVLDNLGEPRHRRGVAEIPGLYFLGLPWLSKMNSSFMAGVGEDAAYLADVIASTSVRTVAHALDVN